MIHGCTDTPVTEQAHDILEKRNYAWFCAYDFTK